MPVDPPPIVDTVEVRAPSLPPAPGSAAWSVAVLDGEQPDARIRLDEALSRVPGVSLFRRTSSAGANPTTQGLALRAFAPSGAGRALVTLDGVPQNDPFGGWVIWTALPAEGLGDLRIVRGAGAGPYGAGALTGVVELIANQRRPGGYVVHLTGGDLGQRRAAASATFGSGPISLALTAAAERTDGWVPVRERRGAADAPLTLDAWNASARLTADLGPTLAALRLAVFREARESGLVGAASSSSGGEASLTLARASEDAPGWRLQAWSRWSNLANTAVAVAADRASTTPANDQNETPALGFGLNGAWRLARPDWTFEIGADARAADGESRERFRYLAGAFTRSRIAGGRTLVAGAYVEADRRLGPWLVTGGARLDHWRTFDARRLETDLASGLPTLNAPGPDRQGEEPTARFAVRRDLGPLHVRAAAYTGFRPPTLNELHRPFRVGNDITEANPALTPERLAGAEIGFGGLAPGSAWSATAFASRLSDAVANVTIGFGPATFPTAGFVPAGGVLRQRQNVGHIDAIGLEAEANQSVGPFGFRQAISWTSARVDGGAAAPQLTGLRPAQSAAFTATAAADWRLGRLSLSGDMRYETARWEDDLNTRRLAPALTVNARAAWIFTPGAEAYIAADNLLDAAVQTGRTADNVVSYAPPRAVRIGLRFSN